MNFRFDFEEFADTTALCQLIQAYFNNSDTTIFNIYINNNYQLILKLRSFPEKCNIMVIDMDKSKAGYGSLYYFNLVPKIKNLPIVQYINKKYPMVIYNGEIKANWETKEVIKITKDFVKQLSKIDKLNNFI